MTAEVSTEEGGGGRPAAHGDQCCPCRSSMATGEADVNGWLLSSLLLSHCCCVLAILDRKGVYVEDEPRRHYRLEDFLWSGSGDGDGSGESEATWATTTIFRTTTVLTTIYPTPVLPSCPGQECHISPTPTFHVAGPTVTLPPPPVYHDVPDQRYWLVTVIEANSTAVDLSPAVFEQRLARLYRTAFHRQQEKHLKLNSNGEREKKTVSRERRETVSVRVLRLRKNSKGGLVLVYTVRVAGKPVDAAVAAQDMNLVADHEVSSLLGFNVLTKAEPFLKQTENAPEPLRDIWLIVGASATAVVLILVLIIVLLLLIGKKKRKRSGSRSRASFLQRDKASGSENMGFQDEVDSTKDEDNNGGATEDRLSRKEMATPGRQPIPSPRPRPRSYKPSTPNSYLSMPSVKAFPRGAAKPGPLEEVLESTVSRNSVLSRHSSESADPGVVGPLVWDLHCHRLNKKGEPHEESPNAELSVGRMRRRFHELLDDAFSLFGSGSASPDEVETTNANNYGRAKSAVVLPVDPLTTDKILRPKTTDACCPSTAGMSRMPRGAWGATPPSTPPRSAPLRPLSAGPFHTPTLEPAWILTDTSLKSTDPAVPLIKAIKSELDKFPYAMPGSYET